MYPDLGDTPCLMSEIGVPFDMDGKKAYTDGKYGNQYAAMDANNYALENAGLNYTLWCYCSNVPILCSALLILEQSQMG
jgi:hypothetical protein